MKKYRNQRTCMCRIQPNASEQRVGLRVGHRVQNAQLIGDKLKKVAELDCSNM